MNDTTLAQRLRNMGPYPCEVAEQAADRIEADAATIASLRDANKALTAKVSEAMGVIALAVPTINAVERLRDIRSAGYPRKSEETSLCEKIESFCDCARRFLEDK